MTNKLQKPSRIWKTGVLYLKTLSQAPIVKEYNKPSAPNSHSLTLVSCDLFPPNVRPTHPELLSASTENLFRLQINKVPIISHCVHANSWLSAHLKREVAGVARRRTEYTK
jgi:hypothetical protein